MRTQITCCKGCTSETGRSPGCHDHCDIYMRQRVEFDAFKAQKIAFEYYENCMKERAYCNKDKAARIKKSKYLHGVKD